MNEYIYQGIIGVLLLVSTFAFYNLYKKDTQVVVKNVLPLDLKQSVNIAFEKAIYENVKSQTLLKKQNKNYQNKNALLSIKLKELQESTQKSIEMIETYNQNNVVAKNINLDELDESIYEYQDLSANLNPAVIEEKIHSLNKSFENYENKEALNSIDNTKPSDSLNINSNSSSFNITSARAFTKKEETLDEKSSSKDDSLEVESQALIPSPEIKVDKDFTKYQRSISDITSIIQQLNKNLE